MEEEFTPETKVLNSFDDEFLKCIMNLIEGNMANESYCLDEIAVDIETSYLSYLERLKS
ncbi:hypothetical protein [Maribacter vaceletii]|uniref:hypothetical protein n=1 Tax=Maribacter vaceletii TaxID=1206816 RepID=UPI0014736206|nr:hypothetical protein [Maribacter vaceletii]